MNRVGKGVSTKGTLQVELQTRWYIIMGFPCSGVKYVLTCPVYDQQYCPYFCCVFKIEVFIVLQPSIKILTCIPNRSEATVSTSEGSNNDDERDNACNLSE